MSERRDRHQRGLRGPLALPNQHVAVPRLAKRRNRENAFTDAVADSVRRIHRRCPEALLGVEIGWEEVPHLATDWSGLHVPLAAAVEGFEDRLARVVVYRRPLELRAATPRGLSILVHRTIVEQLAALTGLTVEQIDPEGHGYDDDW